MVKGISKPIRTSWTEVVLVCAKCERKMKGGFGPSGKHDFGRGLSRALDSGKGLKAAVGIVETRCFDICPRGAVMVGLGSRPGELLAIAGGTPMDEVIERLALRAADKDDER